MRGRSYAAAIVLGWLGLAATVVGAQGLVPSAAVRAWGPLEVAGPNGPATGSVVLIEWSEAWPEGEVRQSLERHYLPGIGLVPEIHIGGTGDGLRLWRYEMKMKSIR